MTADIPKVSRVCGPGIVTLAQLSGRPIVPVAVVTSRRIDFASWDRASLGLPFGRGAMVLGEPVHVARDADAAGARGGAAGGRARPRRRACPRLRARRIARSRRQAPGRGARPHRLGRDRRMSESLPAAGARLPDRARGPGAGRRRAPVLAPAPAVSRSARASASARAGPSRPRPHGHLVWVHGASIGETLSLLPVVERLTQRGLAVLVTSGTRTSAALVQRRLPPGSMHQFVPLDVPRYIRRFLDHWQPDLALVAESEIWPNTILELERRQVPLILVNGRMSDRSFRRWQRLPSMIGALLRRFALCLAQTHEDAERLARLGAPQRRGRRQPEVRRRPAAGGQPRAWRSSPASSPGGRSGSPPRPIRARRRSSSRRTGPSPSRHPHLLTDPRAAPSRSRRRDRGARREGGAARRAALAERSRRTGRRTSTSPTRSARWDCSTG